MIIAAEAFAALADALPEMAGIVGYRIVRGSCLVSRDSCPQTTNHQPRTTNHEPRTTSFPLRCVITEGEQQLTMIGDAAAPTNTPTKTLRVLYADWPQPTPPQVDDEVELPDGSIYRVASVERRIGDYYLITASKRKGR